MPPEVWEEITTECGGITIKGSYKKAGNTVTVKASGGSKAAQLSGLTPEYMAKMLLRELAREGKA
jgi:hypothetical protein